LTVDTRPQPAQETDRRQLRGVAWFFILAYLISWGWSIPLLLQDQVVEQGRGWPTHFPALLGPLIAAVVVTAWTAGRSGLRDFLSRIIRWRVPLKWWLVALSPLLFLGLVVTTMAVAGQTLPALADFGKFGGLPQLGVVPTALAIVVLNGIGEEAGWRGYAQDRLQRRMSPLAATLVVAVLWAMWHAPFFFILASYSGFDASTLVMFPIGLTSGAVLLAWLYNRSGRSILVVAVWHGLYNVAVGTAGGTGTIAAVVSAAVMVGAVAIIILELRARRHQHSIMTPAL
jgi:membrane protease YdiL (CAAX protease family)